MLTRLLSLPFWPNALLLVLFTSVWLLLAPSHNPIAAADGRSRRTFLRAAGLTAATVMLSANVVFAHALLRATRGAHLGGEYLFGWSAPAARQTGFDIDGLSVEVSPVPDFYRMSKNVADPTIDAGDWSLRIHGLVDRPDTLSYADLLTAPRRDAYATLRCISNRTDGRLMSTALFTGVSLRGLLERAGLDPAAQTAVFRSPDGHADSLDLARALADTTLIAYAMNGRTLTRDHGFPARLLAPGVYGFKHVKWLSEIELIAGEFDGTWQNLGWTRAARVKTMSRIDTARREGARVVAAGVAFAGDRGISAVQVQADDGPWKDAILHTPPLSALTWVQWRADLPPDTGRVSVRAVDGSGATQDSQPRGQFPDGAQGLHTVDVSV